MAPGGAVLQQLELVVSYSLSKPRPVDPEELQDMEER